MLFVELLREALPPKLARTFNLPRLLPVFAVLRIVIRRLNVQLLETTAALPRATLRAPFLSAILTLPPQTAALLTPAGVRTRPVRAYLNGRLLSRLGLALSARVVACLPEEGAGAGTVSVRGGGFAAVAGRIGCQSQCSSLRGRLVTRLTSLPSVASIVYTSHWATYGTMVGPISPVSLNSSARPLWKATGLPEETMPAAGRTR